MGGHRSFGDLGRVQLGPDLDAGLRVRILTLEPDDLPWWADGVQPTAGTGFGG